MKRKFTRRARLDSMTGRRATARTTPRAAAGDGQPSGSCRAAPCFACFRDWFFSYLLLFLGTSLEGWEGTNRDRICLGLSLKTPPGRNKVVTLGLFWIVFGFKLVESCSSINQA